MNGWITENNFRKEAESKNYLVTKSTRNDDMHKHIDFHLKKNGQSFSVDVKSRKKASRSNAKFDDEYTWVEFENVRGNRGWLYGDADYIVFEQEDEYIFINRAKLLKFCLNAVSDKYVNNSTQAIYKKYQRFGRKDVISRIKLSHALESEYFNKPPMIWKKSHDGSSN